MFQVVAEVTAYDAYVNRIADGLGVALEDETGYVNLDAETLRRIPSVIEPDPLRALQTLPGVQAASASASSRGKVMKSGRSWVTVVSVHRQAWMPSKN